MKEVQKEADLNTAVCEDLGEYMRRWESATLTYNVSKQDDFDVMAIEYTRMKNCIRNTHKILEACDEFGIDLISVGRKTYFINETSNWPFNHSGSMFTREHRTTKRRKGSIIDPCPAVWAVREMVKEIDIGGASNRNQTQIDKNAVVEGVYLKRDGEWLHVVE